MLIQEWLFEEPIENKIKETYKAKILQQLARKNMKLDDKQFKKEFAKKIINTY